MPSKGVFIHGMELLLPGRNGVYYNCDKFFCLLSRHRLPRLEQQPSGSFVSVRVGQEHRRPTSSFYRRILLVQKLLQFQISFKIFRTLSFATVLIFISSLNFVSATCYGPNACLEGWRQAIPTDYVCVRTQTAQDNAAAASRVNPNGGPYGPDTCLNGYVWREAYTGDHVYVLPTTRAEVTNDNAQAANRVASLSIWTTN